MPSARYLVGHGPGHKTGTLVCQRHDGLLEFERRTALRIAFILSAFNVLVQWHGLITDEQGRVHMSIAEFSL